MKIITDKDLMKTFESCVYTNPEQKNEDRLFLRELIEETPSSGAIPYSLSDNAGGMKFVLGEDGAFREYKEPYATIDIESEESYEKLEEIIREYNDSHSGNTASNGSRWIPVSERYPKEEEYILLSFENFSIPAIGRYESDDQGGAFYIGDEENSCVSQDLIVNAWMPLPVQYREDGVKNESSM